jgi:death-on-curing protein
VSRLVLDAVHLDQLREHGGLQGVRDENALESALARARNKWAYDAISDPAALAAAYGYGLATSHPYHDGNKRVAFLAMATFLGLNGWDLDAREADVVSTMVAVAAGRCRESELAGWLRGRMVMACVSQPRTILDTGDET